MSFISLLTSRLHEEKKTKKSVDRKFPTGYVGKFYRKLAGNIDGAVSSDIYSKIGNDVDIPFLWRCATPTATTVI